MAPIQGNISQLLNVSKKSNFREQGKKWLFLKSIEKYHSILFRKYMPYLYQ